VLPSHLDEYQVLVWVQQTQFQLSSKENPSKLSFRDPNESKTAFISNTYNMSNNTHIPDICRMVHQFTELFRSKVDHSCQKSLSLDVSKFFLKEKVQT